MKDLFIQKRKEFSEFDIIKIGEILLNVDDCEDKTSDFGGNIEESLLLVSKNHETEIGVLGLDVRWDGDELTFRNPLTGKNVEITESQTKELEKFMSSDLTINEDNKQGVLEELDSDKNGVLDIVETQKEFYSLLKSKQNRIIEIDRTYIQQFVKLSNYLISKSDTLQEIFENIKLVQNKTHLDKLLIDLEEQTQSYNMILIHSINMVVSLTSDDMITFYEIYESFDKSNIFQSNWEKEIKEKLEGIESGIESVLNSIGTLEKNLVNEISNLTYITQTSFNDLQDSVINELNGIQSSINFNNLLTGVQTYQLYKINKNTKGLMS